MPEWRRSCAVAFAVAAIGVMNGCNSDDYVAPPLLSPDVLPLTFAIDQHRIVMSVVAPYDTVRLTATVRNVLGAPLTDAVVTFASTDSAARVSADGLITARDRRSGVKIIATTVYRGIRKTDTANVTITNEAAPPRLTTFSIQPPPGSSTTYAQSLLEISKPITVVALDENNAPISDVDTYLGSSNPTIGELTFGELFPMRPGEVTVYASTTYYGVSLRDSVRYIIKPPLFAFIYFKDFVRAADGVRVRYFSPDTVRISAGGWVSWTIYAGEGHDSLDIQFDDPSAATPGCSEYDGCGGEIPETGGTGNIAPFAIDTLVYGSNVRYRRFNIPGRYRYFSTRTASTGTIVVE